MKKNKIIKSIKNAALGFCALALISCSGFGTIVTMPEVKEVPMGQYERIVKLNNPAAQADKTFAGLVLIKKDASICTDYPREEIIKSIDELTMMEKRSYNYLTHYAIESGGRTYGFVSMPADYRVTFWVNEKDENCKYKVQITWLGKEGNDVNKRGNSFGSGGHGH